MVLHTTEDQIDYADGIRALQKIKAPGSGRRAGRNAERGLYTWILMVGVAILLLMLYRGGLVMEECGLA